MEAEKLAIVKAAEPSVEVAIQRKVESQDCYSASLLLGSLAALLPRSQLRSHSWNLNSEAPGLQCSESKSSIK